MNVKQTARNRMIARVRQAQAEGLTAGYVVFDRDGNGGAYYTPGTRLPDRGAGDGVVVALDFAARATPGELVAAALAAE